MPKPYRSLKRDLFLFIAFATSFFGLALNAIDYLGYGEGTSGGCSGPAPDPGVYEPQPSYDLPPSYEPPVQPCEPPPSYEPPVQPCEPPPSYEPPVQPCEPPPSYEPPVQPCEPPPSCEPPVQPPCEPPPSCEPPAHPPCEPQPPCEPHPPCKEPPPCEPPRENPPPPDDNGHDVDVSVIPLIFGDYRQFKIITALPVCAPLVKKECASDKNQNQCEKEIQSDACHVLELKASDADGVFNVDDRRQAMMFIGLLVGIGISDIFGVGAGIGLAAILEGNYDSYVTAADLKKARKARALKRPRNAKDIEKWQIGDRLQYSFGLGGMAPVGVGAFGFGAGFAPIAGHRWRVTIEKISDHLVKIRFDDEHNLAGRIGVGSILINKSLVKAKLKSHKNTYKVDISTDEGKKSFEKLMKYEHFFDGGIKDFDEIKKDEENVYQFVQLTETGDVELKAVDHKKLRVRLPLLFNYSIGKKVEKIHEKNSPCEGDTTESVNCERKVKYRQLTAINNFFKHENRRNLHRVREVNGVAQGQIVFKDGHAIMSAEAKLNIVTNKLKDRHYKKAIKRLNDYIDVNQPVTDSFAWPENIKHKNSFVASVSISLNDDGIKNLLSYREQISTHYPELQTTTNWVNEYLDMNADLQKLYEKLYALDTELHREDKIDDNPEIASILREIIDDIRDSYYLIQTIEMLIPGALSIKMELSGTSIQPVKYDIPVSKLL